MIICSLFGHKLYSDAGFCRCRRCDHSSFIPVSHTVCEEEVVIGEEFLKVRSGIITFDGQTFSPWLEVQKGRKMMPPRIPMSRERASESARGFADAMTNHYRLCFQQQIDEGDKA